MLTVTRKLSVSVPSTGAGKTRWKRSKDRKLIDWRRVRVRGGAGGDGCVNFRWEGRGRIGVADGGDGGDGGGVAFVADSGVRSLAALKPEYRAKAGGWGTGNYQSGSKGKDIIVKVPVGTVVTDSDSGTVLADLLREGERYIAVRGAAGGLGNAIFGSAHDRRPTEATEGELGQERVVGVELKTIADVGLVGFPNAGKSTLLRAISRATPRVASYPFTTLNPHIGMVTYTDIEGVEEDKRHLQIAVADIPGLIPGAHENKGLGHYFLRHIERCQTLLYVLDGSTPSSSSSSSSSSSPPMHQQLDSLQTELHCHNPALCERASLILANKMDDVPSADERKDRISELQRHTRLPIIPISALHGWNILPLKMALLRLYTGTSVLQQ